MMSKEYCRYIRTYSELEGLQHALYIAVPPLRRAL